jgi:hypothetical protein
MTEWSRTFGISNWSAWTSTFQSNEKWLSWAKNPCLLGGQDVPKLEAMQASIRRRTNKLGRVALEPVYKLPKADYPIIFCTRYGELERCFELLKGLAETGDVSPQSFSVAVHNAIPGLYSIDQKLNSNITALAAVGSAHAGLLEAIGLFSQGERVVRLVVCQETTPEVYKTFTNSQLFSYGYAIDLVAGGDLKIGFSEEITVSKDLLTDSDLNLLAFLLDLDRGDYCEEIDGVQWRLSRGCNV